MTNHTAALFTIAPGSAEPIYRQLIEQVRRMIAAGLLAPGDGLPSVRETAQALAVNPMTVSKAWNMLETEGVLTRMRGLGMQVAPRRGGASAAAREKLLRPTLERAVLEARQLELADAEVLELFKSILKETP
ncbi:GntR family transcriptional regulator [Pseudoduganella armeniaca]|uniref:GntR family transcriptional regulator n=1 Tax=Pseudoduganella armeniaca TaxID=2072590 RepID=A0A2R4CCH4_9BURK|nr:GntR family transcriptional regulator [Pseudoduganella armeniaca]AVR97262.1 GntR family transcriptional regulator [Pseudoduganella armeniaca]